jgi:hypothetical protein
LTFLGRLPVEIAEDLDRAFNQFRAPGSSFAPN